MESCLINVRSYYARNEKMYNDYIDGHVSTQGANVADQVATSAGKIARGNLNILLSKINAAMLIKCN